MTHLSMEIPSALLRRFDAARRGLYQTRNEAIRDLLRRFVEEQEAAWTSKGR